jgi:putative transposase
MKASKFSEAQIAFVLTQADEGMAVAEVCRMAGVSQATFYNWHKKYAGLLCYPAHAGNCAHEP